MTTTLVKHPSFADGEAEPEKGSLPKGPSELRWDCRLESGLRSHTSCKRNSGALCTKACGAPWPGEEKESSGLAGHEFGTESLKKGLEVPHSLPSLGVECLKGEIRSPQRLGEGGVTLEDGRTAVSGQKVRCSGQGARGPGCLVPSWSRGLTLSSGSCRGLRGAGCGGLSGPLEEPGCFMALPHLPFSRAA